MRTIVIIAALLAVSAPVSAVATDLLGEWTTRFGAATLWTNDLAVAGVPEHAIFTPAPDAGQPSLLWRVETPTQKFECVDAGDARHFVYTTPVSIHTWTQGDCDAVFTGSTWKVTARGELSALNDEGTRLSYTVDYIRGSGIFG